MKKTRVVAALVILTGCTHRIKFDTLDIGLLLTDIPEEYNPTRKLSQCVVKVDTPCDFERDEYCEIDAINDYKRPTYDYKVSIDSLGHIKFQYDGNANFPPTYMAYFQAPHHPWLEEGLRKRLEEERDVSLENYRREQAREKLFESINSRMVEIPCPECNGGGRIAQSGMGVIHGTLSCPRCMGRGTIKVDPYSPY